jgi:hypothetical protein
VKCIGNVNIPKEWVHPVSGHKTGVLVHDIRSHGTHWRGKPDETERVAWLNALPGWKWGVSLDDAWVDAKEALIAAVSHLKTSCVPKGWVHPVSGHNTGSLVNSIRSGRHWRGKPDEAERLAWLNALPEWTWSVLDDAWEDAKAALLEAVSHLKTARVPYGWVHPVSGHKTGKLVTSIRSQGAHWRGKSDETERVAWLNALPGWKWGVSLDNAWENAKEALLAAVSHLKTACVPQSWVNPVSGHKTGSLVSRIRHSRLHCRGKPDEAERVAWLNALPGWKWGVSLDDAWKDAKAALLAAVSHLKTARVPQDWIHPVSGHKTGLLVKSIRNNGRHWRGKPDETERVAWLTALPGWVW